MTDSPPGGVKHRGKGGNMYYGEHRWKKDGEIHKEIYTAHVNDPGFEAIGVFHWTAKRWAEWRNGPGAAYFFIDDAANDAFNEWLAAHPV